MGDGLGNDTLYPLSELIDFDELDLTSFLPDESFGQLAALLDGVFYTENFAGFDDPNFVVDATFGWEGQLAFGLPGVDAFSVAISPVGSEWTEQRAEVVLGPDAMIRFIDWTVVLRISRELLRPLQAAPSRDLAEGQVEIPIQGEFTLYRYDDEWHFDFDLDEGINFPRAEIGATGVIVTIENVRASVMDDRKGLRFEQAQVELPEDIQGLPDLTIEDGFISSSGFSGAVSATWDVATYSQDGRDYIDEENTEVVGSIFSPDFKFAVEEVSVRFEDNSLADFSIRGIFQLPDGIIGGVSRAELSLTDEGEILIGLYGWGDSSLVSLSKKDLFEIQAKSIAFRRTAEETALTVSGIFQLTHPDVQEIIPAIELDGLTIYKPSDGAWKFRIEGGSVEINKSIDLFGVARADLKEIGLSENNDWNAFTFSGGVQLLDGVDAGAWVEGLRIEWKEGPPFEVGGLSLDGIGLLVVVPDTFEFQGSVVKKEAAGESYFEGAVNLNLLPVKMGLGASLKIGRNDNYTYAFLSADFCMPGPGIQLGALPLYIRCIGGLIGVNTTPDAEGVGQIFALATRAPAGLMHPSKWRGQLGSHAIGLHATISTAEPKFFTMESLLAFIYPELALLIEGQAFVLENPTLGKDPPFHALMAYVFDPPSALINVSAKYDFAKILTIDDAMLEVSYDPSNADMPYYFALGQQTKYGFPIDRPVSTKALQLFSAMSYLILTPKVWALGATIGLPKKRIGFSMASVNFEAIIKGEGAIYWGPEQFKGSLSLSGNVGFRIFKKGFDLWLSASVLGMTPDWVVDALLKFGIKFKILWKKVKFEAQIPFHWERRITPPIPELLREILLQHPATTSTQGPYLQGISDPLPLLARVPHVEPDSIPALTFNYPMHDRTGFPFGQDVSVYQDHKSGGYTFTAELPSGNPGSRGIEMYRMKIADYPNAAKWEGPFTTDANHSNGFLNTGAPPTLYGAWQATKAPDGTGERTHLHLFARTPFEFSRPNRLDREIAQILFDETYESISDYSHLLADDASSVANIPAVTSRLKNFDELRTLDTALPFGPVQYVVNEEPDFPRSRTVGTTEKCMNFLLSRPGWYGREPIYMNGNSDSHLESVSDVVFQGFGVFEVTESGDPQIVDLGNCEIAVDDSLPYPLSFLWIHDDRGLNEDERVVSGTLQNAEFEIVLKHPVRQLTLYIDETIIVKDGEYMEPVSSPTFAAAYLRPIAITALSQRGIPIEPPPTVGTSIAGQITISSDPQGSAFNHIVFTVHESTRIYSMCYEIDYTEELTHKEEQLTGFIDAIWTGGGDSTSEETQPEGGDGASEETQLNGGDNAPLVPGYIYRLEVRTNHAMSGASGGTRHDDYAAFFQISKPPTDLSPYVLTTFPEANQFPHYRAEAYFVRFNRNYVQKLMGGQDRKLHWQLHKSALPLSALPFQESSFGTFLRDRDLNSPEHKGWGWSKANNHELTIQEEIWKDAYNASASADQQINENMIIPDDVIWISPINPVLVRADFSQNDNDSVFQNVVGNGTPIGCWEIMGDSLLHHTPALSTAETPEGTLEANSFLLTTKSIVPPYLLSVWLRPHTDTSGRVGIILAANETLTRYLMIDLNPATQRVRLIRKDMTQNPDKQIRLWADKRIGLGFGHWSRLSVRVVSDSDQLVVALELADQLLFSVATDLSSSLDSGEETYVGLFASSNYAGVFDNFEVLSVDRLNELALGGESHYLALYYQGEDETSKMYEMTALASHYLDLFDHLNSWDRNIWLSQGTAKDDADILGAMHEWEQNNYTLLLTLGELTADEQLCAANLRTLEDLDNTRKRLREDRYNLDESFKTVAETLGLELPIRPERLAFIRADAGKGLLIQSPEPIDWTRLSAGSVKSADAADNNEQSILVYKSDMTCAILILASDATVATFGQGQTYVWTIKQYHDQLPAHLEWLQRLLTHQQKEYQLTLEVP